MSCCALNTCLVVNLSYYLTFFCVCIVQYDTFHTILRPITMSQWDSYKKLNQSVTHCYYKEMYKPLLLLRIYFSSTCNVPRLLETLPGLCRGHTIELQVEAFRMTLFLGTFTDKKDGTIGVFELNEESKKLTTEANIDQTKQTSTQEIWDERSTQQLIDKKRANLFVLKIL